MKKLLASGLILICSILFFSWLFFPYDAVIKSALDDAIQTHKLPIRYGNVTANPQKAVLSGLEWLSLKPVDVGRVEAKYSLLSLITRNIHLYVVGDVINGDTDVSPHDIEFNTVVNMGVLSKAVTEGNVQLKGDIQFDEDQGTIQLFSDKIVAKSDFGPLTFTNITGDATYNKKTLSISQIRSDGKNKLTASGKIFLNMKSYQRSRLQLKGNIDFSGLKKKISVGGTIGRPSVQLK